MRVNTLTFNSGHENESRTKFSFDSGKLAARHVHPASHEHFHVVIGVRVVRVWKCHRPDVGLARLVPFSRAKLNVRWHVLCVKSSERTSVVLYCVGEGRTADRAQRDRNHLKNILFRHEVCTRREHAVEYGGLTALHKSCSGLSLDSPGRRRTAKLRKQQPRQCCLLSVPVPEGVGLRARGTAASERGRPRLRLRPRPPSGGCTGG